MLHLTGGLGVERWPYLAARCGVVGLAYMSVIVARFAQ
jgi:hypothetical protein